MVAVGNNRISTEEYERAVEEAKWVLGRECSTRFSLVCRALLLAHSERRTPGTVEHCGSCCLPQTAVDLDATPIEYDQWKTCENGECPMRGQK